MKKPTGAGGTGVSRGQFLASAEIAKFLQQARILPQRQDGTERGRLLFALDATMSRQPTWDLTCRAQGEMFQALDPSAELGFREFARLSKGAYARFDAEAPKELSSLLRAAVAYAAGGRQSLLNQNSSSAKLLLEQLS